MIFEYFNYKIINVNYIIFIGTIHRFCLEYILRPFGWIYNWTNPRIITYDELLDFFKQAR